jgi:hypothetical protein
MVKSRNPRLSSSRGKKYKSKGKQKRSKGARKSKKIKKRQCGGVDCVTVSDKEEVKKRMRVFFDSYGIRNSYGYSYKNLTSLLEYIFDYCLYSEHVSRIGEIKEFKITDYNDNDKYALEFQDKVVGSLTIKQDESKQFNVTLEGISEDHNINLTLTNNPSNPIIV